jgi:DNA-binding transcriptional MocR family regulator
MQTFAKPFENPAGSPIRELFPYLSRPGIISLAGGYPSLSLFDTEGLAAASQKALMDHAASLQYGATEGSVPLRTGLVQLMHSRGIGVDVNDILVTTGSQQAFDLLIRVCVEPGDAVWVETPAYPAAIQALRLAGAQIGSVPVDEHGLDVDALAQLLQAPGAVKPKLLYTVPTFSNPSGALLTQARRERLVALAVQHGFLLVEDDPYGELQFQALGVKTLCEMGAQAHGKASPVVYLSSLSKTVSPGLRIGWMVAHADILRRCCIAKQTVDLCTSPLAQSVAAHYLASGRYGETVVRASAEYGRRMTALADGLTAALGGRLRWFKPRGGMFMWVEIVQTVDAQALFLAAVEQGVLYVPGSAFYPGLPNTQTLRLSFAAPSVADITEGVQRLARAMQALPG